METIGDAKSTSKEEADSITLSLDAIRALPSGTIRGVLESLFKEAGGDQAMIRKSIEQWFDATMERSSGYYKRYSQRRLFALALLVAVGLNVDTLTIAQRLWSDPLLRQQVALRAESFAKAEAARLEEADKQRAKSDASSVSAEETQLEQSRKRVESLRKELELLPVGWPPAWPNIEGYAQVEVSTGRSTRFERCEVQADGTCLECLPRPEIGSACLVPDWTQKRPRVTGEPGETVGAVTYLWTEYISDHPGVLLLAIIGWLLTAFAASLGAPFWFDGLGRLLSLRASVRQATPNTSDPQSDASTPTPTPTPPPQPISVIVDAGRDSKPEGDSGGVVMTTPTSTPGARDEFEETSLSPDDIRAVQRALGIPEAAVTGVLDATTRKAVASEQLRLGRSPTGTLSPALVARLLGEG